MLQDEEMIWCGGFIQGCPVKHYKAVKLILFVQNVDDAHSYNTLFCFIKNWAVLW